MKIKALLFLWILPCLVFADKPNLFLLKTYDNAQPIIGWVMSEKLDGVRGFWNGSKLISRSGKPLNPPDWFIKNYPPFAIDGELWTRRGDFENISSITSRQNPDNRWRQITHQIFEVPNQSGGLLMRLGILQTYLQNNPHQFIKIIQQTPIDSQQQVHNFLDKVISKNGEGIVVRNPKTPYQTGRLSSALKVKKFYDKECIVVSILTGKGKYSDKMGALGCRLKNGETLKIGSGFSDAMRENPPKIGSQITFKYYGKTQRGKHKYPVFLKIKPKLTY